MRDMYSVIKIPLITEKATLLQKADQLVFEVNPRANKIEIRNVVEKIFKVRVKSVQTIRVKGKLRRVGHFLGRRPNRKKAIVRLYPGQHIEFFEGV